MENLASHTFVLLNVRLCLHIYTEMILCLSTNMKKIIRLDALVSMRDMSVRARPPPRGQHPAARKIYFVPLVSEIAGKNTAIFFKCQLLSDVTA